MFRVFITFLVSTVLAISMPFEVHAQENARATKIESCLTDTAIGFARARLDRLDFTSLEQLAKKSFADQQEVNERVEASLAPVKQLREQFIDAGVTEFYVILDLEYFMFGPYILLEHRDDADIEQIANLIREVAGHFDLFTGNTIQPFQGFLFAGDQQIFDHLHAGHLAPRPHLATALQAVDAHAVQVVYCPTDDQLRAIRETVPPLPPPGEQLDGVKLADGIQLATIGLQLKPGPVVSFRMHSRNEESAEFLKQLQHDSLDLVAELTQKMMPVPEFDQIVKTLKLERSGVELSLDFQTGEPQNLEPLIQLVTPMIESQLKSTRHNQFKNTLKYFGISMHNWHDVHRVLPAHANYSQDETPLLSWRVHLLPYLGNQELYEQFHLDEPWDSPHNKALIPLMPDIFKVPGSVVAKEGKTGIVFPILPDGSAITTGTKLGNRFQDITDGTSNTVMITVVDDDHSVIWTKPGDLTIDPDKPLQGLLHWELPNGQRAIPTTIADGSVRLLPANMDATLWLKILTCAGREVIEWP